MERRNQEQTKGSWTKEGQERRTRRGARRENQGCPKASRPSLPHRRVFWAHLYTWIIHQQSISSAHATNTGGTAPFCLPAWAGHQHKSSSRSGGSNTGGQHDARQTTACVPLKTNSKDIAGEKKKCFKMTPQGCGVRQGAITKLQNTDCMSGPGPALRWGLSQLAA